jgi:hypothetical protein
VWHGFIDIVFSSHLGVPSIASALVEEEEETTPKKRKLDEGDGNGFELLKVHKPCYS